MKRTLILVGLLVALAALLAGCYVQAPALAEKVVVVTKLVEVSIPTETPTPSPSALSGPTPTPTAELTATRTPSASGGPTSTPTGTPTKECFRLTPALVLPATRTNTPAPTATTEPTVTPTEMPTEMPTAPTTNTPVTIPPDVVDGYLRFLPKYRPDTPDIIKAKVRGTVLGAWDAPSGMAEGDTVTYVNVAIGNGPVQWEISSLYEGEQQLEITGELVIDLLYHRRSPGRPVSLTVGEEIWMNDGYIYLPERLTEREPCEATRERRGYTAAYCEWVDRMYKDTETIHKATGVAVGEDSKITFQPGEIERLNGVAILVTES